MNIREEILKEHSKEHALRIAQYACASKQNFKQLMLCFTEDHYRLSQRAAWSVSWAARMKPEMIKPYIGLLVQQLQNKQAHPAVTRNAVRILQEIELPEAFHGEIMNSCFTFIETPATPVAIKAFSLTTLFRLSKIYPEIGQELKTIIEERWETETAAFRVRGKKILTALQRP